MFRQLLHGEKVKVYRNLHKRCYSVQDITGRVVAHVNNLLLTDATFKVREAGRNKVLRTKRKNVHAFVIGKVADSAFGIDKEGRDLPVKIRYNPYVAGYFRDEADRPVKGALGVLLTDKGISGCYLE